MRIVQIKHKEDFVHHYQWIKEINLFEITPEICLSKCLTGEFWGYLGLMNNKPVGLVIGRTYGDMAFIVGLWCKNNLKNFLPSFWNVLKKNGYKTARSSSKLSREAYQRLMSMDELWTVYERIL